MKLLAILVPAVTIVGACSRGDHGKNSNATASPIGTTVVDGTGDGGGGNFCKDRMIESHRLYVEEDQAYIQHIVPLLEEIKETNGDMFRLVTYAIRTKNWYVLPCELKTLSPKKIASMVETEQGALQDFREVWIEEKKMQGISGDSQRALSARADLYLHEMLMAIRLLMFDSPERECLSFAPEASYCSEGYSKTERGRPRDLTPIDYQEIRRAVVLALKLSKGKRRGDDWENLLAETNFKLDGRGLLRHEDRKPVTTKQILEALRKASVRRALPTYGYDQQAYTNKQKSQGRCDLKIEISKDETKLLIGLRTHTGKVIRQEYKIQDATSSGNFKKYWSTSGVLLPSNAFTAQLGEKIPQINLRIDRLSTDAIVMAEYNNSTVCTKRAKVNNDEEQCVASSSSGEENASDQNYYCSDQPVSTDD